MTNGQLLACALAGYEAQNRYYAVVEYPAMPPWDALSDAQRADVMDRVQRALDHRTATSLTPAEAILLPVHLHVGHDIFARVVAVVASAFVPPATMKRLA